MWKNAFLSIAGSALALFFAARLQPQQPGLPSFLLAVFLFSLLLGSAILAGLRLIPEERYPLWILTAVFATGGIYLMGCNPWVSIIGDNIVYIRDALEIAGGKSPLQVGYGLGITSMLIPALTLFQENVVAAKATIGLSGMLFPLFAFLVLRRYAAQDRAFVVAVLSGTLPVVVDYSGQIMADLPYGAFSLAALYVLLRYLERYDLDRSNPWPWFAGYSLVLGWAYHVKSPAAILVLAAGLYLVLRKQISKALWVAAGAVVWIVPWMVLRSKYAGRAGYISDISDQIRRGEHMPDGKIGDFWHNLAYFLFEKNPRDYLDNLGDLFFSFDFPGERWLVLGLILAGFFAAKELKKRNLLAFLKSLEIHDWYVMGYMALLFALPGSPPRYLIPVIPFLLCYFFRGAEFLAGLPRNAFLERTAPAVLALAIFLSSFHADIGIITFRRTQKGYPGYWENYYKAALWIRDNTPPRIRVAARKPTLVWFWSGRESDVYPRTRDIETAWKGLKKFDYVLVDYLPFFPDTPKYLIPVLQAHPDSFEVVHATPPPPNYVLRIKKK